jgi:hypothetical protein
MLKIDFDGVFKNLDTKKSASQKRKKREKIPSQALQLGNYSGISHLPDKVDSEFLSMYAQTLDDMLYPYVARGKVSISYASKYAQKVVENVFGNEEHLGIYHYLKDKNVEGISDKQIVSQSEKMLGQGWHINKQSNGRYWLYNTELEPVLDMTGDSEESIDADAQTFDVQNAHLFFDIRTAGKIHALANTVGYDADELSRVGKLDVLLNEADGNLFGFLTNYERMKAVVEKSTTYRTLTQGKTLFDLYDEGYYYSDTLIPNGVVLSKQSDDVIIFPVEGPVGEAHLFNKHLLGIMAQQVRESIYSRFKNIKFQKVEELKDMRYTFALMSEFIDTNYTRRSYMESENILSKSSEDIESDLAVIIVTESILLGNEWFNSTSFGYDAISNSFYVYFNKDAFTRSDLETLTMPAKSGVYAYSTNALEYVEKLPKKYKSALQEAGIDTSELDVEMNSVQEYFGAAKNFILQELN